MFRLSLVSVMLAPNCVPLRGIANTYNKLVSQFPYGDTESVSCDGNRKQTDKWIIKLIVSLIELDLQSLNRDL